MWAHIVVGGGRFLTVGKVAGSRGLGGSGRRGTFRRFLSVGTAMATLAGLFWFGSLAVSPPASAAPAAPAPVVISEIMYDPPSDLDADEFIELHNPGPVDIDVSGWCMDGVDFCFPAGSEVAAGQYVVISPDPDATLATYGVSTVGTYGGKLKNGGEEVSISDAAGNVVHGFTYDDVHPWPTTPDGQGPSLELISLDADLGDPWNWAASVSPKRSGCRLHERPYWRRRSGFSDGSASCKGSWLLCRARTRTSVPAVLHCLQGLFASHCFPRLLAVSRCRVDALYSRNETPTLLGRVHGHDPASRPTSPTWTARATIAA